jgi:hypothetical protein
MKKIFLLLTMLISAVFFFACASTPPAEVATLTSAQDRAEAAMQKAKSVKADVAVKADFNKAHSAYTEAQGMTGETAIPKYLEAEGLFLTAHDAAVSKREDARKQLEKAKTDIKAVESEAEELKKQQQGGAQ